MRDYLHSHQLISASHYLLWRKMEDVVSNEDAYQVLELKDLPMGDFESHIWNSYGKLCVPADRRLGPYLDTATTHLHRILENENVLIVKFLEDGKCCMDRIFKELLF